MNNMQRLFGLDVFFKYRPITFPPKCSEAFWCDHEHFFLRISGVAVYHVEAPRNTIYIDPDPTLVNTSIIDTWLYGRVLAFLLHYHGYLILHGSAIACKTGAIILCGASGAGKSTLAMLMTMRGYSLMTDDMAVIQIQACGKMELMPAFPRVKLWSDVLTHLNITKDHLKPVLNKQDKFNVSIDNSCQQPQPVHRLYILNHKHEKSVNDITHLSTKSAWHALISHTYQYTMLKSLKKLPMHLGQINQWLQTIPVYQMDVIHHGRLFQPLVDILITHLEHGNRIDFTTY